MPVREVWFVHGYNFRFKNALPPMPVRVSSIGYSNELVENINVTIGILVLLLIAGAVTYLVSKLSSSQSKKLRPIALTMLKKYLLFVVLFQSLNLSYCVGLQFKYGSPTNTNYTISIVATVASLMLVVGTIITKLITSKDEFGEYSTSLKRRVLPQAFFAVLLFYRISLGLLLSTFNEVEEATILNVFLAIVFVLYTAGNLFFKKVYNNYHTVSVRVGELVVLSVAMYERSMRSNTRPAKRYSHSTPGMLELAVLISSVGIATGISMYEAYVKLIQPYFSKRASAVVAPRPRERIEVTIFNILEEEPAATVHTEVASALRA